jgi:predicted RNA-binding protein with PUA-like domain
MSRESDEPKPDQDNPEWTAADFAAATKFPHGLRLTDLKPGELVQIMEKRRSQQEP